MGCIKIRIANYNDAGRLIYIVYSETPSIIRYHIKIVVL